ncbi:MAG: hypothetical protein M3R14_10910, partial [Acidobacteriota bacterium]|nr:hypothetical protein [Acidobacteriota bacterium]
MKPHVNSSQNAKTRRRGDAEIKPETWNLGTETKDQKPKTIDHLWLLGCFAITVVAAFLRFWQLELKP